MGVYNTELFNNLGLCCFYAQQYDMALNCFERALSLSTDENMADVWYNIGQVALVINHYITLNWLESHINDISYYFYSALVTWLCLINVSVSPWPPTIIMLSRTIILVCWSSEKEILTKQESFFKLHRIWLH
jgi:tetratricopeptide (TPR) repeat protein